MICPIVSLDLGSRDTLTSIASQALVGDHSGDRMRCLSHDAGRYDDDFAVAVSRRISRVVARHSGDPLVSARAIVAEQDGEAARAARAVGQRRVGEHDAGSARGARQVLVPCARVQGERVVRMLDARFGQVPSRDQIDVVPRDLRLERADRKKRETDGREAHEDHQREHERTAA